MLLAPAPATAVAASSSNVAGKAIRRDRGRPSAAPDSRAAARAQSAFCGYIFTLHPRPNGGLSACLPEIESINSTAAAYPFERTAAGGWGGRSAGGALGRGLPGGCTAPGRAGWVWVGWFRRRNTSPATGARCGGVRRLACIGTHRIPASHSALGGAGLWRLLLKRKQQPPQTDLDTSVGSATPVGL